MSGINPIYKITVFTILALFINIEIVSGQIIINEVCASNSNLISDFEGDYNDWIEITNIGSEPVNLAGYCLRDDADDQSQWCFPEYMLGPGEYLLLFASGKDIKSIPINWKTLVSEGDLWKYIIPASEIPLWRSVDFNESAWSTGASGIGYGDGDDATTIPSTLSLYMRISFNLNDATQIDAAALHIDYDDGFVAYINGNEIARSFVSGTPPAFDARATGLREAIMYSGGKPERYDISNPGSVFLNGRNILAIEVHNDNDGSSDMTSIPFLSVLSSGETGSPPPLILDLQGKLFHTNFKLNSDGDSLYHWLKITTFFPLFRNSQCFFFFDLTGIY